jgi:hypothetical protein
MKTLLFLAFCSITLLYSCTKKLDDPKRVDFAMSAVIDGKFETFNSGDSVRTINNYGVYITGVNDTTSDRIGIYVGNTQGTFGPGTYTDTTANNVMASQILMYPAADYNHYYYSYYIKGTYNFTSTVTITSVDSTNLQGTFSGSIVLVDYISGTSALKNKVITNGQFNINRKK